MENKENRLEQIFWKEGKFVNSKGKEVKAKQIGKSSLLETCAHGNLGDYLLEILDSLKRKEKIYEEVNAFLKGDELQNVGTFSLGYCVSIQSFNLYKI